MNPGMPQFLLFTETGPGPVSGAWRFILRAVDGVKHFEAADVEADVFGERLDLLTLVRALESLDQPSRVTLIGCSNYLRQGIQFGMPDWRMNDWNWEWFGQMVPVKNADLWQRLDRLMSFHQVECRLRRIDGAHPARAMPNYLAPRKVAANRFHAAVKAWSAKAWNWMPAAVRQRTVEIKKKLREFALACTKALRNPLVYLIQGWTWGLGIGD
jgi:ribonuclease HI